MEITKIIAIIHLSSPVQIKAAIWINNLELMAITVIITFKLIIF